MAPGAALLPPGAATAAAHPPALAEALCEEQQRVKELAMAGCNLFLTGCGGCGKSFLIQDLVSSWQREGKEVGGCARWRSWVRPGCRGRAATFCCWQIPLLARTGVPQQAHTWVPSSAVPRDRRPAAAPPVCDATTTRPPPPPPCHQVALCAMTGCAAELIGGSTLHSVLKLGVVSKARLGWGVPSRGAGRRLLAWKRNATPAAPGPEPAAALHPPAPCTHHAPPTCRRWETW